MGDKGEETVGERLKVKDRGQETGGEKWKVRD